MLATIFKTNPKLERGRWAIPRKIALADASGWSFSLSQQLGRHLRSLTDVRNRPLQRQAFCDVLTTTLQNDVYSCVIRQSDQVF